MLRKGALESGLGEIILTVLVAAVISGAMFGPLGAKMGEGFKEAEKFTQVNTTVVVDDKETFGDLLKYEYARAWHCDKVDSETFPGLASTSLGANPPCAGAGGTLVKGVSELYDSTGQDMEGKFGRVNFKINESFILRTGEAFGPSEVETTLLGVSTGRLTRAGYEDWIRTNCDDYHPGVNDGFRRSGKLTDDTQYLMKGKPESFFTLFFTGGEGTDRVVRSGGNTIEDRSEEWGISHLYCDSAAAGKGSWLTKPGDDVGEPKDPAEGESYVSSKLCKGDKGYIEVRKHLPQNEGEASGGWLGSANFADNNDNLYGMIQITDKNSSCSMNDGEVNPNEPVISSLSSSPDSYSFGGQQVLYQEGGQNIFRPDDSSGNDQMVWEGLSSGQKSVEFEVLFKDRGHFRIDVINSSNDRVTNINTDATGTDGMWMYCTTCDDSNSPPFTDPRDGGDGYGIVWNYDLNTAYKIEIARNAGEISWTISDGTGVTLWSFSKDMNSDFSRVELEAWESWNGGATDDAVVRINDIEVSD